MKIMFQDPTFAFEFLRILGESTFGGSDINECFDTASRIEEGNCDSWFKEWNRTGERINKIADQCLALGHSVSAREAYLRASNYYRCAEFFLHMEIGMEDPHALPTYDRSVQCFHQAGRLFPFNYEEINIPYKKTTLPGYFFSPAGASFEGPLLIIHGGFDSIGEELYFNTVPAALSRGYRCLIFEGPGQGAMIRHQNIPFRPDWEHVVSPVIDYALTRPEVDPTRIVLEGRSLGGYLAPRAAAFDHRLAACIAIDGMFTFIPNNLPPQITSEMKSNSTEEKFNKLLFDGMKKNLYLHWALSQGMWNMQASSLFDLVNNKMSQYSLEGVVSNIRCPTLICEAENDLSYAGQPKKLFDALLCPKTYVLYTKEDAAEEHCHEELVTC